MNMQKKYSSVLVNTLLIFACVFFQRCTNQDTITPHQEDKVTENIDVLQKIKSLGFTENQIKETPNYYLADGDLYFSKKISSTTTSPGKKSRHRTLEKYATLTIHVDESLAGVMDEHWRAGIDQAIAEWNADEKVHFHFALTNSAEANINIVKDTDLPTDLAIASEFPRDGRTGSNIRINVTATKVVEDTKQAFAHALEHCVGFLHSTSLKNKDVKINSNALKIAVGPRFSYELYAIQGDWLYRINGLTGEYVPVDKGWAGTEVMGDGKPFLYMVQFGTLYAVDPFSGVYDPLTDGWEGSQYITSIQGGKLYIMQNGYIWPVNHDTGTWDPNIGSFSLARGLIYIKSGSLRGRLAVLRRKPGSSTVSLLYSILPSNGAVLSQTTISASGEPNWNGNFFLTASYDLINYTSYEDLNVFNGKSNVIRDPNQFRYSSWPYVEAVTSGFLSSTDTSSIYVISSGTLWLLDHNGIAQKRLGNYNEWAGTSCLVSLWAV